MTILVLILMLACIWVAISVLRTEAERDHLSKVICTQAVGYARFHFLYRGLLQTPEFRHFLARLTLRDPWALYPPKLQPLIDSMGVRA